MPAYSPRSTVQALATATSQRTPPEIACPRCGVIDTPTVGPGNGPHPFRATGLHCGPFLPWLSAVPPAERQARRQQARQEAMTKLPPSTRQLEYLKALGDDGSPPARMLEASERIAAVWRGERAR